MDENDFPNVLIIGAPKCGTTSMFQWLSNHPEVCGSDPKETWFFAGEELEYLDIRPNHRLDSLDSYLDCFKEVSDSTRVKMEGSTHYLYSDEALDFFASLDPQPKLIVLLRDPAARIWSHFNYIKQRAKRPISICFPDYVDRLIGDGDDSDEPFAEERWPRFLLNSQLSYSNYQAHLSKWLARFPRENLFVAVLEDLTHRKGEVAHEIAEWLGIDASFYDEYPFSTANVAKTRKASITRRRFAAYADYFPETVVRRVKALFDALPAPARPTQTSDDQQAIDRLAEHFRDANERLGRELKVDVSRWRSH